MVAAGDRRPRAHVARARPRVACYGSSGHGTLVCVHGNPTWSYLWRRFVAEAPPGWRVVAVDQLGMGFSERFSAPRVLAGADRRPGRRARRAGRRRAGGGRGARLGRGGVAGLGGAAPRPGLGTRAGQHGGAPAVGLVGARADPAGPDAGAAARGVRGDTGVRAGGDGAVASPAARGRAEGVRGAVRVGGAAAGGRGVRRGHPARPRARERRDPGRDRRGGPQARRRAGAAAVGAARPGVLRPLPARPAGPPAARGRAALREGVASGAGGRAGGGGARVGVDRRARPGSWPRAAGASRTAVMAPKCRTPASEPRYGSEVQGGPALWTALEARAGDPSPAVVALGGRTISWDLLVRRVHELAVGLADHGVAPGDRVALLVPPGADLTAAAHACWRAGASVVVADPGLGAAGLARALRGAHPAHVVGALPGLALAAALGVPGSRIAAGWVPLPGASTTLAALARRGRALLDGGATPPARGRAGRRGGRPVHLGRHGPGQGRRLPAPPGTGAARGVARGRTGSPRTTGWSPPSRPSRCTGPRSESRRRCRQC